MEIKIPSGAGTTHMFGISPLTKYSQIFRKLNFNWGPDYEIISKYQVLPLGNSETITIDVVDVSGLRSTGKIFIMGWQGSKP